MRHLLTLVSVSDTAGINTIASSSKWLLSTSLRWSRTSSTKRNAHLSFLHGEGPQLSRSRAKAVAISHHLLPPISSLKAQLSSTSFTAALKPSDRNHQNVTGSRSTASMSTKSSNAEDDTKYMVTELGDCKPPSLFSGLKQEFPCLLKNPLSGPEPAYDKVVSGYKMFTHSQPFYMKYNECVLPELKIAYETWGELNEDKSNAILLSAGLSASSHAKSHPDNEKPGWWEKFIGSGCALDTDKYFVICTNTLGGCYGSSGPSTLNPETGIPYGTTFPLVSVSDMVNAQFLLLDSLGIEKIYAVVGSSLGGMCSLSACVHFPDRVGRMISISSCAQSHPTSIAVRYLQRKCIMTDPNWEHGHYYGKTYPRNGMKMARELGTMTYRSGPEWSERFGRKRINPEEHPALCPTFLIESYLDYQGEMFCTMYDPNSLLYVSKAMDLFDIADDHADAIEALQKITCPIMVLGVNTDILFPIWQQRELAASCRTAGHTRVTFYELDSIYGHDTFLLDLNGVGSAVKGFLDTEQSVTGRVRERKDHS